MADLKISELTSATSVAVSDYFVIVQTGETRKVTPEVLFANAPSHLVCKELPETIASGAISTSVLTTIISSASAADQILTLATGTHGMEKDIVVSVLSNSYIATLTVTNAKGFSTIVFNAVGQTVKLKNISGFWYILGSKGATIA